MILETQRLATVVVYSGTHDFPITSLVFLGEGRELVSGSADGSVLVHKVPDIDGGGGWMYAVLVLLIVLVLFLVSGGNREIEY
jgi:WD40 repeat protein